MLREEGRVVALDGDYAVVSSRRKSACGGCHAHGSCNTLSGGLGNREIEIRAINRAEARVGEAVVVELSEKQFLKVSFLVYMVPLLALFVVGAGVRGWLLAAGHPPDQAEGMGALAGLGALGLTFFLLRRYNNAIAGRSGQQPVVASIIHHQPACPSDCSGSHC